jgi:hypothetical protein
MIACLKGGPTAFASHLCAAAIWGLDGFSQNIVEVSTTRRVLPIPGMVVHQVRPPPPDDVRQSGPFKVSSPARTLIELATDLDDEALENAVDEVLRRRLTSLRRLAWRLDQIGARGMRGAARLRRVLMDRDPTQRPESGLERRFLRLLAAKGFSEARNAVRDLRRHRVRGTR